MIEFYYKLWELVFPVEMRTRVVGITTGIATKDGYLA